MSLWKSSIRAVVVVFAALCLASCGSLRYSTLTNPTVRVRVEHPPTLGLAIEKVTFSPENEPSSGLSEILGLFSDNLGLSSDDCGAELQQRLTQMLIRGGVEVTNANFLTDADAAIALDVTRCDGEREQFTTSEEIVEKTDDGTRRRTVVQYHSRTRVFLRALFEVTDVSTGSVVLSRSFEFAPEATNVGDKDYPRYPSSEDLIRVAYRRATNGIRPIFFGWVEARDLVFFDDERCGLNLAFRAVEAGDYERALELSIANVASCQPDPQAEIAEADLAAAHYNVGVLHRIRGDFDSALASLEEGHRTDPGNGIIERAIDETLSAEAVAAALSRAEQDARGHVVTNDVVIGMFEDGLDDKIIIQVIETSQVAFDVSPATLGDLNRLGLSEDVISAMITAAGR